jgi:hypothetical protein
MTAKSRMVGLRATHEDAALFTQAAELCEMSTSSWMRENLKKIALKQVYGKDDGDEFPATAGEIALFRAVMVILQTVSIGTPDDTKRLYAEKAARQIEKIKSGEKVP